MIADSHSAATQEVFDMLPSRFNAAAAAGVNATYQFNLTGEGGGTWQIAVADGALEVVQGAPNAAPNITIKMAASDYVDMISGNLKPKKAFMGGKLKIKGDMSLAFLMADLFPKKKK